jgi:uncharacterized protein (DUF2141 family)
MVVGNRIDPTNTTTGRMLYFRNEGTRTAPKFRLADTLALDSAYHVAPAFADLDGDGDLDMLLGTWNQDVLYFRNAGTAQEPRFVQDTALTIRPPRVSYATPALADIDGDGDLDLFIGGANGAIIHFRNDGTRTAPNFVLVTETLDDLDVGRRSAPSLVDVDGDGLLDLVVGREASGVAVFRNAGTRTAPRFVPFDGWSLALPPMSTPAFGDLDGDGKLDLVSGTVSGGLVFYRGTAR